MGTVRTMARVSLLLSALILVTGTLSDPSSAFAQGGKKRVKKKKSPPPSSASASPAADAAPARPAGQDQLDAALAHFKEERYSLAAVSLHDVASMDGASTEVREAARYNLAKALYRMELHHSALEYFAELLEAGPSSRYYRSALEWSLFVARKVVAEDRVLDLIARHTDGNFPDAYKNEFKYLLAKYHYLKGHAIESGAEIGKLGETRVEETVTGGVSLKGDIFDDASGADDSKKDDSVGLKKGSKGGFSLDEDIFGDEKPKEEAPKPEVVVPSTGGELAAKEHFELANRYVLQVEGESPFAAQAKFLEGVLLYHSGRDNEALDALKAVVRLTKDAESKEDLKLRQLAFFQLARTHFGAKQPSFSIFYYDKIERFTYAWLEALYEASWAEFRLGNYEKALGNLLTLHSPFFEDQYFPESRILKAVVYYENCRYKEANDILQAFKTRYEPVLKELQELAQSSGSTGKYYESLKNLESSDIAQVGGAEKAKIIARILAIALGDRELKKLDRSYKEVEAELRSYDAQGDAFARSRLREVLDKSIGDVLASLEKDASKAVKRKIEQESRLIKTLITQAIRIEIETARAEQERIESKLRDVETAPARRSREFVEWADDEKLVWPFEEEYWRDELGTYELTLAQTCQ